MGWADPSSATWLMGRTGEGFVSSSHLCQVGQEQLKGRDGGG